MVIVSSELQARRRLLTKDARDKSRSKELGKGERNHGNLNIRNERTRRQQADHLFFSAPRHSILLVLKAEGRISIQNI
jgi:hypothetical protein